MGIFGDHSMYRSDVGGTDISLIYRPNYIMKY